MKQKKFDVLIGWSLVQAVAASVVVWLWGQLMTHGEQWFGKTTDSTVMPAVLIIFMIAAVLSAGSVLGYPLYLAFHENDWPKAIKLLIWTLAWLMIIAIILVAIFIR